jgi:hypothetical protein
VAEVYGGDAAMTIMGTWAIGAFTKGGSWEPGVDFGAVNYPTKPERILLFHPDTYGCTVGAPEMAVAGQWLQLDRRHPVDVRHQDPPSSNQSAECGLRDKTNNDHGSATSTHNSQAELGRRMFFAAAPDVRVMQRGV